MTKPKGKRVASFPGSAPKSRKNATERTAEATLAVMMKPKKDKIGEREAACDERDAKTAEQQWEEQLPKQEAELDKRDEQRRVEGTDSTPPTYCWRGSVGAMRGGQERERDAALAEAITPQQRARRGAVFVKRAEIPVGHPSGALLTASMSQDILPFYFSFARDGMEENRL
eukprot:jgi/Undpi1/543/HiC_scaffold_10.g04007.m1